MCLVIRLLMLKCVLIGCKYRVYNWFKKEKTSPKLVDLPYPLKKTILRQKEKDTISVPFPSVSATCLYVLPGRNWPEVRPAFSCRKQSW